MDSEKERDQSSADERPQGRDAVRRSILRAARVRFAREGTRGSLRDIAAAARVNVGLIHRHFGRKDELVQEVIADTLEQGVKRLDSSTSAPEAIQQMFLGSTGNTDFVRMLAWLALEGNGDSPGPLASAQQRVIGQVRAMSPQKPDHDLRLMAALTVIFGWSIFSQEMLSAFDIEPSGREDIERRLAELLANIVTEPSESA
ncbi:TetR/AcrR family transcriptional regulator [Rhodococcus sp. H29-C3]|uniref:TetR/AcrR family transcriptional regulator n=1 Tax=Rhodococcus sp. H29-C3 TaxID=3046307 RepID=UPI0024BB9040|nr:TetR/AcrR family transcriptional regulator [Rhodococcus sp. H29-C3]MDJ0359288.1 helix-turn-helix domain-containing protein [Rhodococcus sp. H29-C3]